MSTRKYVKFCFLLACCVLLGLLVRGRFDPRAAARLSSVAKAKAATTLAEQYGKLPLRFEEAAARGAFSARGDGYALLLNGTEAWLKLRTREASAGNEARVALLKMALVGARAPRGVTGVEPSPGQSHYFIGNDPSRWRTNVAGFARVRVEQVYPGVDLVWYGNQRNLEHDFVVAPGADASLIKLAFAGAEKIVIDGQGNLQLTAGGGALELRKPQAWQVAGGARRAVACEFRLGKNKQVEFQLGAYDAGRELVIDPVLVYSTFIGGLGFDEARAVAVGSDGSDYIAGTTSSPDFPGSSPIQQNRSSQSDAFVLKLNPAGDAVVYATWLGGNGSETAEAVAVDAAGNAVITGTTSSSNFPMKDPLQATPRDGAEGFVTKLNATGTALIYSTFLGGTGSDGPLGVAVDAAGNAYLTGFTESQDFPLMNALQPIRQGSTVYSTNNAGANWAATDSSLNAAFTNDLATDPTNPAVIYAATERGVFKTINGGVAWARFGGQFNFPVFRLLIDPASPMTLYARSIGLFKSVDGGESWNQLVGISSVISLAAAATMPTTLYAVTANGVLKSTDGGANWTPVVIRPGQGGPVIGIGAFIADPITPTTLYAGGAQAVYKSADAGTTWQTINTGLSPGGGFSVNDLFISRGNPSVLIALLSSGGLYRTTNGGANWQSIAIPNVFLYGGLAFFPPPDVAIDPADANTIYVGTPANGVYKSTDGGRNWNAANNGLNNSSVRALAIPNGSPMTVYAGTSSGAKAFLTKINAAGSALIYSTYLGGSDSDFGSDVEVDADGNAYVAGTTNSKDFPTRNAYQAALKGDFDAFVAKINPAGSALVWSTFVGGSGRDSASGLAINGAGNVFITGVTTSTNFPVVKAIQAANRSVSPNEYDAFVTRLSADGQTLDYSTYLGGSANEISRVDIAVDAASNAYVASATRSPDFPIVNAVQPRLAGNPQFPSEDAFITKISADGASLLYSTYLGGSQGEEVVGIAVDAAGNVYIVGGTDSSDFPLTPGAPRTFNRPRDGFIAKLAISADLAVTISDEPDPVQVNGNLTYRVIVANDGPDLAAGASVSITLPPGATFVSASSTLGSCAGSGPLNCTLGNLAAAAKATVTVVVRPTATGTLSLQASAASATFDINSANNTATQTTKVSTLPSIFGRVTTSNGQGLSGVTVTLSGGGRPAAVTGGDGGYQFAELAAGANYTVTPTKPGFVFSPASREFSNLTADQRADFAAAGALTVTSAASFSVLGVASESIAAAFGVNLANDVVVATTTPLPTTLGGATLRIRDSAGREADAPLFFVSPQQINLLVPRGLANGPALATVLRGGSAVATGVIEIVSVNPGLISADATGTGYAAAVALRVKADGSQVFEPVTQYNAAQNRFDPVPIDVSNPAEQVFVLLFGTGIRNRTSLAGVVTRVGGEVVETQYAGDQGGFAGLDQLNVRLPSLLTGKGDVAVEVTVDGKAANPVRLRIR